MKTVQLADGDAIAHVHSVEEGVPVLAGGPFGACAGHGAYGAGARRALRRPRPRQSRRQR
ncbi:hypothetical protein OHA98_38980 [Streptomyces sp. NBC_00654]|uniref:hypothetical protein n=1 Tax=Streptomyces sp. NBC_00654 TaxID=2975799 RepID=UPI00224FD51A|nr:hypothetical protein [Streptomyces sp. NBC_00654]MCX4970636.1 hypothetical protein [Streptomyces sp. NBC_00654]